MTEKDYYGILGVDQSAEHSEIRAAYRKLALQHHPDRNKDNPAATEKMKDVNEAYAILSDPVKRQEYDELRKQDGQSASERYKQTHTTQDIFRGSDINQVYADLAKQFKLRNFDKVFREAYGPSYRSFEFQNKGVYGRAFVFYGTPKSTKEAAHRKGGAVRQSTQETDTELARLVQKMAKGVETPKKGKDRKNTIILSPKLASQGGEAELSFKQQGKTRKLKIKIPAGIKEGQQIRLKGMGDVGKGGGEPGDLYLEVRLKNSLQNKLRSLFLS
jgi:curved DNA-binding protein